MAALLSMSDIGLDLEKESDEDLKDIDQLENETAR
jgi:hypothetical protein